MSGTGRQAGPTSARWLLYGAYGYTGRLIVERAIDLGLRPVVAGRDGARTQALAEEHGLEWATFGLDQPGALPAALRDVDLVFNAAGPFSATWRPVLEACLAARCHYLDITGEIDVLEAMQERADEAREAGVHVVPAVGFDVVPTDCAAALAAEMLDDANELVLALSVSGGASRGTTRTTLERLGQGGAVRRDGRIVPVAIGSERRTIAFMDRARRGTAIPWGDVSTAYRSTGIPNITVYATLPSGLTWLGRGFGVLLRAEPLRRLAELAVDRLVTGPGSKELASGHARVRAEVRNDRGDSAAVELVTPNAYALTAAAAVAAVQRVLGGDVRQAPGIHTPSGAFGADFVLGLPGVRRVTDDGGHDDGAGI